MRKNLAITLGLAASAAAFAVGGVVIGPILWPHSPTDIAPALDPVPPLQPLTRTSVVVAPASISLAAIRDALEAAAPHSFAGKRDNPLSKLLAKADIGWTVERGPLAVVGRPDGLAISTALTGTLRASGQVSDQVGNLGGVIGNLLGRDVGQQVQGLAGKTFDQHADLRGSVTVTSRPTLTPAWRLEPNLTAQVSVGNSAMNVAGIRLSVPGEVKPFLDRSVGDQVQALQAQLHDNAFLESAARREWAKLCRAIPLRAADAGALNLWLEVRPTHAFAAQPSVSADAVNLVIGVQAETRVVAAETKPDCPFPAHLAIVPQLKQGRAHVAVPIDIPFTELNRLLEAQLTGRRLPEDGSGSVEVTIKSAALAASGDRLLISLRVDTREKGWFSFGAEATVHVWGQPVLDREQQILRLADIALDVQSEAAFGLLGAAARAATPYLKKALAEKAVVDLKPWMEDARKRIAAAVAEATEQAAGIRIDTAITALRLAGIDFDDHTLRVIAEADGAIDLAVTAVPLP